MTKPTVVVLDYGSGNLRSAERALARAGAEVTVTPSLVEAAEADGLVVPGVGAFAAVMRHIREVDSQHHTVIAMQVENEVGVMGSTRDFRPEANAAFAGPVPKELTDYLQKNRDNLLPEFKKIWDAAGNKTTPGKATVVLND